MTNDSNASRNNTRRIDRRITGSAPCSLTHKNVSLWGSDGAGDVVSVFIWWWLTLC